MKRQTILVTTAEREEIRRLHAEGKSYGEISQLVGRAKSTVNRAVNGYYKRLTDRRPPISRKVTATVTIVTAKARLEQTVDADTAKTIMQLLMGF